MYILVEINYHNVVDEWTLCTSEHLFIKISGYSDCDNKLNVQKTNPYLALHFLFSEESSI
jgi:hypothetical protein